MKFLDRIADRVAEKSKRDDSALVMHGMDAGKRLWLRSCARWLVGLGALVSIPWGIDTEFYFLWLLVLSFLIVDGSFSVTRRAQAFRSGWLAGRNDMIGQLTKSENVTEWVDRCFLFDTVHVMGISPVTPDTPEGLEE